MDIGTELGHYRITGTLGAGGMGEVYRAEDARLGREVAIKVLPDDLADDAERRQRFEREARTISHLNHPHICTLHDIGEAEGVCFLVMELLEGETLAERLGHGLMPLAEVLRCGEEIASGLAAAHHQGVVHRDLKPGNVILTRAGAKLLDFGLAKPSSADSASDSSATRVGPLTSEGMVLGTVQYMAPEQLEGRVADERADLFALRALLYEMVSLPSPATAGPA